MEEEIADDDDGGEDSPTPSTAAAGGTLSMGRDNDMKDITGGHGSRQTVSTENDELERRRWETSIEAKSLMPWPQFEAGAQDHVSIPATEVTNPGFWPLLSKPTFSLSFHPGHTRLGSL